MPMHDQGWPFDRQDCVATTQHYPPAGNPRTFDKKTSQYKNNKNPAMRSSGASRVLQ